MNYSKPLQWNAFSSQGTTKVGAFSKLRHGGTSTGTIQHFAVEEVSLEHKVLQINFSLRIISFMQSSF